MLSGSLSYCINRQSPAPRSTSDTFMPRSEIRKATLFVTTDDEWYEADQSKTEIHVGIWWHLGQKLIGFAQPISAFRKPKGLIDSDLSHADAWDMARRQLSCPSDVEYFAIPRGRILWHAHREMGVLYHGNATPTGVLSMVAKLFGLPRWEANSDEHYLVGDALDACMNQE